MLLEDGGRDELAPPVWSAWSPVETDLSAADSVMAPNIVRKGQVHRSLCRRSLGRAGNFSAFSTEAFIAKAKVL